jgi:hypothetical protein
MIAIIPTPPVPILVEKLVAEHAQPSQPSSVLVLLQSEPSSLLYRPFSAALELPSLLEQPLPSVLVQGWIAKAHCPPCLTNPASFLLLASSSQSEVPVQGPF